MRTRRMRIAAILLLPLGGLLAASSPAPAASLNDIVDITLLTPSPVPGEFAGPNVPMRWDDRCIPVHYRVNNTLDPIPNPLGAPVLTVDQVMATFQAAAKKWNDIPTSYMQFQIDGTYANAGPRRLDFVNEITFYTTIFFRGATSRFITDSDEPLMSGRAIRLLADFQFEDGADLDGDGDADASSAIATCQDVDGDGDIEFPAGLYKAGTLLDVDIVMNAGVPGQGPTLPGFRFTVGDSYLDSDPRSVDLEAVAMQAFALAHSLSHSASNQASDTDGRAATLFSFLDTSDPDAERDARELDEDAIATTSYYYPEGTATSGVRALQPGDVPFAQRYGVISGEIFHGTLGQALLGANVIARDWQTGRVVGEGVSGTSRLSSTPDGRGGTFLDAAFHVIDGRYAIPLPPGLYSVSIEAPDGQPSRSFNFNTQGIIANVLGQNHFHEDFYDGPGEAAVERRPGRSVPVRVRAGETVTGIDITTNRTTDLAGFGSFNLLGLAGAGPGDWLAVRIPGQDFLAADAALAGGAIVHSAEFLTGLADTSAVPKFQDAWLAGGSLQADGSARIDFHHAFAHRSPFIGQDFDFTPFYMDDPEDVAEQIRHDLEHGRIADLFLVLRVPAGPFPGPSGQPPLIGLDGGPGNDVPIRGNSFVSHDGVVFTPSTAYNFLFQLVLSEDPH